MRAHASSCRFLAFVTFVASLAWAQTPSVASGEAARPLRVEIIGASVSAGFTDGPMTGGSADNRTVPLQKVVRGWLDGIDAKVQSRADLLMFTDAEGRGSAQIERAVKNPPDLVVAVDFLFWYGYGYVDATPDGEAAARKARFEHGLALLDRLPCPIVVGDLPDVHGAAARMISPRQIPPVAILEQLNTVLADWARARPRVRVFPLRELVADMKGKGIALPLAAGPLQVQPGGLMQGDKLHATRLGMAYLGFLLQTHAAAVLPKDVAVLPRRPFDDFVIAADAGGDLDDLRGKPATAGAAATPPGK
jgi:hypothetical protein